MDEKKTVALTAGAGVSLAAAAAGLMMRDPWMRAASVVMDRGFDRDPLSFLGLSAEPRIRASRPAHRNRKLTAAKVKRNAKRKAQKRARAATRKHRKHG